MQPLVPPMPPPGPTNQYQDLLNQLNAVFTVTPLTIPICTMSQSVRFDWRVTGPDVGDPHIHFTLAVGANKYAVGPVGSQSVQYSSPIAFPIAFGFYALYRDDQGYIRAAKSFENGSVTAAPSPNSYTCEFTAQYVARQENASLEAAVGSRISKYDMQLNGEPGWAIDAAGIHIHLSLAWPAEVDLIDIGVDATVVPVLHQGQLSLVLTDFKVQANFQWWAYLVNPVSVTSAELFINTVLIPNLRSTFADWVQQAINNLPLPIQQLQSTGCVIAQVQLRQDSSHHYWVIAFTLCCPPFAVAPLPTENTIHATKGQLFSGNVAIVKNVFCVEPEGFVAFIDWGDGTTKTGGTLTAFAPPPQDVVVAFLVSGTHTYVAAGTFPVTITVTGRGETANGTVTAIVG